MKSDVLTVAAILFLLGLLVSGLGIFDFEREVQVPSDLQRGTLTQAD